MRKMLMAAALLGSWLTAATAHAQSGNAPLPPAGSNVLPRANNNYLNNIPFNNNSFGNSPFGGYGYNNPYASFGGNGGFNPSPFANYYNNPFGAFGQVWGGNQFGNGYGFSTPYNNGQTFVQQAGPFGGYQYYGYGNFSPVVGMSNGWGGYNPLYDPNSPVNQALTNLFIQGLPRYNDMPSSKPGLR